MIFKNYSKIIIPILIASIISSMFFFKFEVVTPGDGVITGGAGDIDVVTPDSGFINFLNVKVGDEIEKGEIIFSYKNLDVFHKNESLQHAIDFLEKKKTAIENDLNSLSKIYESFSHSMDLSEHVEDSIDDEFGSYTRTFIWQLESIKTKQEELEQLEKMNIAEAKELELQYEILKGNISLLEKSRSPRIEILEKQKELAQIKASKINLQQKMLTANFDVQNEKESFLINILEKINQISEQKYQIEKEILESQSALKLALGKENANVILSPVSGVILDINKQFTVGSYIEASQKVLTIEQLQTTSLIEAKFSSKYRPFISKGLIAKITINSQGYKKVIKGAVESISADSFVDETNPQSKDRFYKVKIEPDHIADFNNDMIGIQVNVFLITENITIFEYIFATVIDGFHFNVW